jgi:hypothetical protein
MAEQFVRRLKNYRVIRPEGIKFRRRVHYLLFNLVEFSLKQIEPEPPVYGRSFQGCRKKLGRRIPQKGGFYRRESMPGVRLVFLYITL